MLDFGCGDATTTIPVAKLGVNDLGVDIADNLVRQCKLKYKFSPSPSWVKYYWGSIYIAAIKKVITDRIRPYIKTL